MAASSSRGSRDESLNMINLSTVQIYTDFIEGKFK
jgi:hypothetical protein